VTDSDSSLLYFGKNVGIISSYNISTYTLVFLLRKGGRSFDLPELDTTFWVPRRCARDYFFGGFCIRSIIFLSLL